MPGFHHSVAVLSFPFRRSTVVKFRYSVKSRKKIPFRYSRIRQKAVVTVLPLKIGSSCVLFFRCTVAGQPIIEAKEPRHRDNMLVDSYFFASDIKTLWKPVRLYIRALWDIIGGNYNFHQILLQF